MTKPAEATMGHNSGGERLRSFIERAERLIEEKKALQADIAEIFKEAKGAGFAPKIMREIIRERAMDAEEREARAAMLERYRRALGDYADSPLGAAALERVA